jgi:hypothetical protein
LGRLIVFFPNRTAKHKKTVHLHKPVSVIWKKQEKHQLFKSLKNKYIEEEW